MPEDGLSTDRNMLLTCKGTILIKINLCCIRLSQCSLFSDKHNGMTSIRIAVDTFYTV
jgi:hypothetical protein